MLRPLLSNAYKYIYVYTKGVKYKRNCVRLKERAGGKDGNKKTFTHRREVKAVITCTLRNDM